MPLAFLQMRSPLLAGTAVVVFIGYLVTLEWRLGQTRLQAKRQIEFASCSAGRLLVDCTKHFGQPGNGYTALGGRERISLWGSGFPGRSSTLAIVSRDGVIIEVLDLESGGGERLGTKYPQPQESY